MDKEKYRKFLPYLVVFLSFSGIILLSVILIDSLILPALIHSGGTVKVPNVTGKSSADAEKILSQSGLTIAKVTEQFSDVIPQGQVISQMPKAGQEVKSGRALYLTVSKGQEAVFVPYLVGQPSRSARILLKNKGLEVGNVEYGPSDTYGPDTVVIQKIPSGKQLPFGAKVDLVVSRGGDSQVKVPQLEGIKLDDAIKLLTANGLVQGVVSSTKNETYLPNTILKQNPSFGELVKKGTPVNLTISK